MNNPKLQEEIKESDPDELHVLDILQEMRNEGLQPEFIKLLLRYVLEYEGLKDLMEMWMEEDSLQERDQIIVDLQDELEEIVNAPENPKEHPYLRFDDLETIKKDVLHFKELLRKEVDKYGGISKLARKTGIPQPSLSRFFASASMPRRTTLYKIAKALGVSESDVIFKWVI